MQQPSSAIENALASSVRAALIGQLEPLTRDVKDLKGLAIAGDRDRRRVRDDALKRLMTPQRPSLLKPGDLLVKLMATAVLAAMPRRPILEIIEERYGDPIAAVLKAAVDPATTTQAGWAAELVQVAIADFLESLMPISIYPQLAARGFRFTFGRNGQVKVPARQATPAIAGDFVGEGQPIPVKRAGLSSVTLTPYKLGVISLFTRELANHSTPSVEAVIRQAINEDTAVTLDTHLLDANPGVTGVRPPGLLNGVASLPPNGGPPADAMIADLRDLIIPIVALNGGRALVVLLNPAQALSMAFLMTPAAGFLFGPDDGEGRRFKVVPITSTTIAAGTVIMIDAADFATATGEIPEFDVATGMSVHMDDTPLPLVGGSTQPPGLADVAAPQRSAWQTASLGLRMLLDVSWAMRRSGMITWMQGVSW